MPGDAVGIGHCRRLGLRIFPGKVVEGDAITFGIMRSETLALNGFFFGPNHVISFL